MDILVSTCSEAIVETWCAMKEMKESTEEIGGGRRRYEERKGGCGKR